jgi:proline iminopeptidase
MITAGGVAHWVKVVGDGDVPLVLLHGGPGGNTVPVENSVGAGLAKHTKIVFYDQRGCGRSEHPAEPGTYTMDRLVADLEEIREALGFERIIPWGVSFGCLLAAEYAVAHPERVDRLVLHAPPIWGPLHPGLWALRPHAVETVLNQAARADLRRELDALTDPIERLIAAIQALGASGDSDRFVYYDPANKPSHETPDMNMEMALSLVGKERPELVDDLAATGLSTLVMIGLWDRHVGFDLARDLTDRLPNAVLRIFDRSGHLIDEEQPTEYVQTIADFVRKP